MTKPARKPSRCIGIRVRPEVLTHFRIDDDRLWAWYARGTEGCTEGTADRIENISSHIFGLWGRTFPDPRWGLEGTVEWQDREDGNDYLTVSAIVLRRF